MPAALASAMLVFLPLQLVSEAQEQAPVAPAAAPTGGRGGRGLGGGRGFGADDDAVGAARDPGRAGGDESSRDRAVNQETFLRNEFGVRTFG